MSVTTKICSSAIEETHFVFLYRPRKDIEREKEDGEEEERSGLRSAEK